MKAKLGRQPRSCSGFFTPYKVLALAVTFLAICVSPLPPAAWNDSAFKGPAAEVVDCIVAVVNSQAITLADLKISDAFELFPLPSLLDVQERRRRILDKFIDQKVVVDLAHEKRPVEKERVEGEWKTLVARFGPDDLRLRLDEFGISADDLKAYLEEKIRCETIIANRFGRSSGVSLKEIEAYYAGKYAPAQKKLGREPKPMIEVLDVIEAEIKKEKIETQVALWIKNLRQQAEIEVRPDCLKN